MGQFLTPTDLSAFVEIDEAKATEMIADAEAMAALAAPCITTAEFQADSTLSAALRAVLRAAVLRWDEAGTGALQTRQEVAGPFSNMQGYDTRQQRRAMFWPSEIEQLRDLCTRHTGGATGAFALDMAPSSSTVHRPWCSLYFGAAYCSCGADLAGAPLYEA